MFTSSEAINEIEIIRTNLLREVSQIEMEEYKKVVLKQTIVNVTLDSINKIHDQINTELKDMASLV